MQSAIAALDPAGPQAAALTQLSWLLISVAGVVTVMVVIATLVAVFGKGSLRKLMAGRGMLVAGGFIAPVIVLTILLIYSLGVTAKVTAEPAAGDLRIRLSGEMWWWRAHYLDGETVKFETANEIRIPVGRAVTFDLTSNDVIHSFWVPQLGGKMDMIPGRTNRLRLQADEPGVYRGQCTEYCGGAHALMAFEVVAQPQAEFDAWAAGQAQPVSAPLHPGWTVFANSGCGACHTVRGTDANGRVGPDLTHLASRRMIAAGIQPNNEASLRKFIARASHIKPGLRMPDYQRLEQPDLDALVSWLGTLL
jgi:cytochrome c oxidase subunit II